jgi:RNA polymerase sigma factor (sigma-70 family)
MTDSEIIAFAILPKTRRKGFELLVNKYQSKIYWHVRKMVIDHDDADDLVQDTFVKVWLSLETFRGDSQLYTWIYRIATNECLNFIKKKRNKNQVSIDDYNNELIAQIDNDPMTTGDEIQKALQKAILTLPDKQRLVFNMKYFEEMKYEAIAEITGTSVGALKATYHIAVKKIEEILSSD